MDLLLEIISHQRHAMTEDQSKFVFKAAGGTIGRNQDNDWSIDDPERLISGQHASIQFAQNQFFILDNSTNGLFVNHEQQALGQFHHVITNGDIFLLGQYSIQATIISTQAKAVFSQSAHDAFNTCPVNEASIPLFPHELPQNSSQFIDPLSQLNDGLAPGRLLEKDILAEPDAINSVLDPIPSTQSYFDLPKAIPENWLKNDTDNMDTHTKIIHSNSSQNYAHSQSSHKETLLKSNSIVQQNNNMTKENIVGDFEDFKSDFNITDPDKDNFVSESEFITPKHNSTNLNRQEQQSILKKQNNECHDSAAVSSLINNQELIKILLENLGINSNDVSPEHLPELLKNIGLITKNSMSGIMKIMMSRAHLKNEFRMSMTTIQTKENNPLKFCINYEQLVHYMLVKPMSGYMDSEQAVIQSFDELQEHQVGVMAGMKSALSYMLEKLSPEKIIKKTNKTKSKTLTLNSKKSRYWDGFNELYNDIKNEDDAFTMMFGNEFCRAYERQIEDIRQARK